MDIQVPSSVQQGSVLNANGTTFVADRLVQNVLGFNITQRQLITGIGCLLLGYLLAD